MKNKNIETGRLLRRSLNSTETPDPELIKKVKYELIKEEPVLKKSTVKRSFGTVAAAVAAFVLISTTAFAAAYFLKPSEVADKFEDPTLSAAFESETAVNINSSVTSGDYIFTLLAVVTGEDITDLPYYSNDVQNERTYAVVAIQNTDGTPMPDTQDDSYGQTSFFASPLVKGLKPWQVNAFTLNGGYSEAVVDGIMYRIVECDGIAMFADRGLYFAVSTGTFYDVNAFIYDEQTGEITANKDFDGASAVFDLPLDKDLADPVKAEQYLNKLSEPSDDVMDDDADSIDVPVWNDAVPVDSTIKELTVGKEGEITYSYNTDKYGSGKVTAMFDVCFKDNNTAQSVIIQEVIQGTEGEDNTVYAIRFSMDEKGVITGAIVVPE